MKDALFEVADIMDYMLKIKNIEIEIDLLGFSLGEENCYSVRFDKQRFQQIFLNFLSNAVKFVKGPGKIKVVLFKL